MKKASFYLITVSIGCLFQLFLLNEARTEEPECTIDWIKNAENYSTHGDVVITGDDPQRPFFRWTEWILEDTYYLTVVDREDYEVIFSIEGDIPQTIQYGDYSQPGTSPGRGVNIPAPPLELDHDYEIYFGGILAGGATYGFLIMGTKCRLSPPDITASKGRYSKFVYISWTVVQGATRYELYREAVLLYSGPNLEYRDIKDENSDLDIDKKYEYTIKACNSEGCSILNSDIGYLHSEGRKAISPILWLLKIPNERKRPDQ